MAQSYTSNENSMNYEEAPEFFRVQKNKKNGDVTLWIKIDDRSELECLMSEDSAYSMAMTLLVAVTNEDVANKVHELIEKESPENKPKDYHSMDLGEMYYEFEKKYNPYPVQMSYCSAFNCALKDGLIDKEIFEKARKYYGKLWMYVGD